MIVLDFLFVAIALTATYFVIRASTAVVEVRRDVAATTEEIRRDVLVTRKQVKELLRNINRTDAHATRILERAYHHQQELNALMANPNVRAAIRHAEKDS